MQSKTVVAGFGLKYANFPKLGSDQLDEGENGYFSAQATQYSSAPN